MRRLAILGLLFSILHLAAQDKTHAFMQPLSTWLESMKNGDAQSASTLLSSQFFMDYGKPDALAYNAALIGQSDSSKGILLPADTESLEYAVVQDDKGLEYTLVKLPAKSMVTVIRPLSSTDRARLNTYWEGKNIRAIDVRNEKIVLSLEIPVVILPAVSGEENRLYFWMSPTDKSTLDKNVQAKANAFFN